MTEKRKWVRGPTTYHSVRGLYSTPIVSDDFRFDMLYKAQTMGDAITAAEDTILRMNAGEAHPALLAAARAVCDKARECEIASHNASYMGVQDSLCDELDTRLDALRALPPA